MEIISRKEAKEKGLTRYFTGKPCKHGHIADRWVSGGGCSECKRLKAEKKAEYDKIYRIRNADKIKEAKKESYEEKKDLVRKKHKKYYEQNKVKIKKNSNRYYYENLDKIKEYRKEKYQLQKEEINKKTRDKRSKCGKFRLMESMRKLVKRTIKNKEDRTESILGYKKEKLINRIEYQFKEGMSWDNYGTSGWHIDHKKPISRFLAQGVTDPKIINALSNLQPLWAHENLSKGAKFND